MYINKTPELGFKFSASLPLSRNTESFNKIKLLMEQLLVDCTHQKITMASQCGQKSVFSNI